MSIIETERLILRTWRDDDTDEYYRINQDPKVIELLPGPLTMQEVKDFMTAMNEQFEKLNFTLFAVEEKSTENLIGFTGLNPPKWESHFTPCVEIGWRLGSIRVMEKIGMQRDMNGDFSHPKLPPDHKLSKHVLYRIKRPG